MRAWRFLPPIEGSGAFHMAADVALIEAIRAGQSGPVWRFYHWTPPCVTLGKFQPAEGNVRLDNCARLGIDVARRPTGGRAILHDNEVTFSIIVAEEDLPEAGSSIMDSYRVLGEALAGGLCRLGVDAQLIDRHATAVRGGDPASVMSAGNPACFAAKARCDLMVNEKKIIGSAQMRKNGLILQQNSLPLSIDFPKWDEVFFRSDWEAVMKAGAVDLFTAAGREVVYDDVVNALITGCEEVLDVRMEEGGLTRAETDRANELLAEYSVLATR